MTIGLKGAGYRVSGYDVMTMPAATVDNQGEPCEQCALADRVIECGVYGVDKWNPGDHITLDCCVYCVPSVVQTLDALAPVTVEMTAEAFLRLYLRVESHPSFTAYQTSLPYFLGELEHGANGDDNRMTGPDDMRPHGDAL